MVEMSLDEMSEIAPERLAEIAAIRDEDIDTSDIPEMTDEFWEKVPPFPTGPKELISIRLDRFILDYFKAQGPRYQSRINAVLRSYVMAQQQNEQQQNEQQSPITSRRS
jgi:uncharacterized protein (DUF4415 family)